MFIFVLDNVTEQGHLLLQDTLSAWNGKGKRQRQVFLFEDLVVFSKSRKEAGGVEVLHYKNLLKVG